MSPVDNLEWTTFERFDGGRRATGDPRIIADNELYILQNVIPTAFGTGLEARLGWYSVSANVTTIAGTPVYTYYWAEKDKFIILEHTSGTANGSWNWKLWQVDSNGSNKTSIYNGANTARMPHVSSFLYGASNRLFIAWGDKIASWDGTTLTNPHHVDCPKASYLLVRFDQLFATGDPDNPSRIHLSDTLDPANWSSGNGGFFDVGADEQSELTSITDDAGVMWCFKSGKDPSIWLVHGSPSVAYSQISYKQNAPSIYPFSHITTPYGQMCTSRAGVWLIMGQGLSAQMVDVSSQIRSELQTRMAKPWLGEGRLGYSHRFDALFLKVQTTGTLYTAQSMKIGRLIGRRFAWADYTGPQIAAMSNGDYLVGLNENNNEQLMSYGEKYNQEGTAVVVADYDTAERKIACSVGTKETNCGRPDYRKNIRAFLCDLNVDGTTTGTATVEFYNDGSATPMGVNITIDGMGQSKEVQRLNYKCDTTRAVISWQQSLAGNLDNLSRINVIGIANRKIHDIVRGRV